MNITQATPSSVDLLWSQLEPTIGQCKTLEDAAQALAASLHETFEESVVLARVFFTVPQLALPPNNAKFVKELAGGAELKPTTPVLSLIGTHGRQQEWNDRRSSRGHVGIPLISTDFVGAIPMISRLLRELGVPLQWIDSHDSEIIKATVGESSGLFFVEDAAKTTDQKGRKIITAQDFVANHQVKSVFGVGSAYPSGQIVVAVVFCGESLTREVAEHFLALSDAFRNKTQDLVGQARVFVEA